LVYHNIVVVAHNVVDSALSSLEALWKGRWLLQTLSAVAKVIVWGEDSLSLRLLEERGMWRDISAEVFLMEGIVVSVRKVALGLWLLIASSLATLVVWPQITFDGGVVLFKVDLGWNLLGRVGERNTGMLVRGCFGIVEIRWRARVSDSLVCRLDRSLVVLDELFDHQGVLRLDRHALVSVGVSLPFDDRWGNAHWTRLLRPYFLVCLLTLEGRLPW
jgi:hypothetical protein